MNEPRRGVWVRSAIDESPRLVIVGIVTALAVSLLSLRIFLLLPELSRGTFADRLQTLLAGSVQDLSLTCAIALLALAAAAPFPRPRPAIVWATFGACLLVVAYAVANLEIVRIIGEPVTIDWLRYSDFLSGARNGILYAMSGNALFVVLAIPLAFAAMAATCVALLLRLAPASPRMAAGAACVVLIGLLYSGLEAVPTAPGAKLANPVVAFTKSLVVPAQPHFVDLPAGNPLEGHEDPHPAAALPGGVPAKPDVPAIENVVLFVLESVPAEYVYDYPSVKPVTPHLSKYTAHALRFDSIYAHAPATNYSLFSLLTSIVPELSSTGMTEKHPDLPLPSIANVLSDRGYRTAFITSSDSRFQSTDRFLKNKGFGTIEDFRSVTCDRTYKNSDEKWRYMDFVSDLCTVDRLKSWIAEDTSQPFFAMLWTGMTHYPYFPEGEVEPYVPDESLNRFLNALRIGDEAFGNLMKFLEQRGLAEKTLVVVVGDHGEAFGQHGTYVHASAIYEENIHIPLLLINATAFSGERSGVIGGAKDVAPTILDLVGSPRPERWQGRSLFDADRPGSVHFFSPWNGFKVGYREGTRKYIYNSDSRRLETYDLATDPKETKDLTKPEDPEREQALKRIAGWVRYQNSFIQNVIMGEPSAGKLATSHPKASIRVAATGTSFLTPPRARVEVDDVELGFFEVTAAPKNEQETADAAAIYQAVTEFEFPLEPGTCPKQIRIAFLNDEWDENKKIGDTNLFVQGIEVNGVGFSADELKTETPDAASEYHGYMALWRRGSVRLDVDAVRACG